MFWSWSSSGHLSTLTEQEVGNNLKNRNQLIFDFRHIFWRWKVNIKLPIFLETIYLLILQSYKYQNIAKEQGNPEKSILSSALLFSYHCVQFALEVIIISLLAYSHQWGCKYHCTVVNFPYLKSKSSFRFESGLWVLSCPLHIFLVVMESIHLPYYLLYIYKSHTTQM